MKNSNALTLVLLIVMIFGISIYVIRRNILYYDKSLNNGVVNEDERVSNTDDITGFSFETSKKREINIIYDEEEYYNVVNFGGVSKILIGNKEYYLEDALNTNIISVDNIIEQLRKDAKEGLCKAETYKDGGSIEYDYNNFTAIVTARLMEERQEIIFAPTNKEINGVFNTYLNIKDSQYTGSDYDEGIGISCIVSQLLNDNKMLVKWNEMDYLVKIEENTEVEEGIEEGDTVNLVFSGQYEEGYRYEKRHISSYDDTGIKVKYYITDSNDFDIEYTIQEVLSQRCWLVKDVRNNFDDLTMLIIDEDAEIEGNPDVGLGVKTENGFTEMSWNSYLKDVTKIEKAK